MSTNKTTNYNLHSWFPEDDFLRTEMNENFTKLDTLLKNETAALSAALGQKARVTVGSYTGDGALDRTISLPFTPKAVLLFNQEGMTYYSNTYIGGLAVEGVPCRFRLGAGAYYEILGIVPGGFRVHYQSWSGSPTTRRNSNENGGTYLYLAVG